MYEYTLHSSRSIKCANSVAGRIGTLHNAYRPELCDGLIWLTAKCLGSLRLGRTFLCSLSLIRQIAEIIGMYTKSAIHLLLRIKDSKRPSSSLEGSDTECPQSIQWFGHTGYRVFLGHPLVWTYRIPSVPRPSSGLDIPDTECPHPSSGLDGPDTECAQAIQWLRRAGYRVALAQNHHSKTQFFYLTNICTVIQKTKKSINDTLSLF